MCSSIASAGKYARPKPARAEMRSNGIALNQRSLDPNFHLAPVSCERREPKFA